MDSTALNHKNRWQEVRLFISSTFRDMQAERDYLIRHVFPRVREELLKRHLYFVDIDLRWGLTSEDDIIGACRSIIDECRPLFLGILGGRYGWVPKDIPQSISITEDEIEHAIEKFQETGYEGVYFLFRDEASNLSISEAFRQEYLEPEGSESANKLERLKERVCSAGLNYDYYKAAWNPSTNRFTGLNEFGSKVFDYIMNFVEKSFGPACGSSSEFDEEDSIEEIFINQRSRFFIDTGLGPVFESITAAIEARKENNVVLLTGQSGTGKSAFLCKLIQSINLQQGFRVLHHFIGVTPHSGSLEGTLRRLCHLLASECGSRDPLPQELDKLVIHFQNLIVRIPPQIPTVIVIDGLNQLFDSNSAHELLWLPQFIPSNVALILSTTPHPIIDSMAKRWPDLIKKELNGLGEEASHQLVNHYLSRYQKRLTPQQIELLLNKTESRIPLYLSTVVEELRIYGDYEGLNAFVKSLPGKLESLLEWILTNRLMHSAEFTDETGRPVSEFFVPRYLSFLYISQSGLSEAELSQLLEPAGSMNNTAAITRQLRSFLLLHGVLLNFYHDAIKTAVFNTFVRNADLRGLHRELADLFRKKADPSGDSRWKSELVRPFSQLLYHTLQLEDLEALESLALSGFFEKYAKLASTEIVLREIKLVIQALSSDPDNEHWKAVVRCARVFSQVAGFSARTGYDKAHPLESAIAEGRDEDVETLLMASSFGAEASVLRSAAKTLYAASGRIQKSKELEVDYSESILDELRDSQETYVLFSAINNQEEKAEVKPEEEKDRGSDPGTDVTEDTPDQGAPDQDTPDQDTADRKIPDQDIPAVPRRHIPVWQLFSLMFTGRYKKIMGVVGYICFAVLIFFIFFRLHIFDLIDVIKNWKISIRFIKSAAENILYFIIGAVSLGAPYYLIKAIYEKLTILLMSKSENCMLSLATAMQGMRARTKLHVFIRITQYVHKLRQSGISETTFKSESISRILANEIRDMLHSQRIKHAGLAAACVMNLDSRTRDAVADVLRSQPNDVLYRVMQRMLTYERIFIDPPEVIDFILRIYGRTPPVPILMKAISLQDKTDADEVIGSLNSVEKPLLARSLVRFLPSFKTGKRLKLIKKVKSIIGKEFFAIPLILNVRDLLDKIPLIVLLIPVAFVAFTFALILLCYVPYIIILVLTYPLYRLCKYWDRHECMADEVGSYSVSYFEDDLRNWFSWKEPGKRAGASMVETAIADALINGNEDPEAILGDFSAKTVLRVWRALLVPGRVKNRGKLLLPLMESEELLKKALARMPFGKSHHERPIDDDVRRKQQKRVNPVSPKWVSSIVMIFASALICAVSLGILCLAWDKWLCILLMKRGWLILACSVFAGLLPFPKIRYLITVLLPILPIIIFGQIHAKPFVLGEEAIYSLFPTYSLFLANEVVKLWRGVRLIYPTKASLIMNRLKATAMSLAGGVLIGAAVVLSLYSANYVFDGEQKPEISEISVLKEYADAMRWADNHKALYRKPLKHYFEYPLDFNPQNIYQFNIYTLGYRAYTLSNLITALYNYGYIQECSNCQKRLSDYYGWTVAESRNFSGTNKTVLLDAERRRVSVVPIIVAVYKDTQADKLGLEDGDVIESVNGNPVIYPEDLTAYLAQPVKGSDKITIAIRRMNKRLEFKATGGDLGAQIWYINADYLRK